MALNFPNNRDQLDPPQPSGPLQDGDAFTDAGQTWTWNSGLGVWSTEAGGGADLDALYLSKRNDDEAAGAITFKGQTTHEGGVEVTGGTPNPDSNIGQITFNDNKLQITGGGNGTYLEHFEGGFVTIGDHTRAALPQIGGMYAGTGYSSDASQGYAFVDRTKVENIIGKKPLRSFLAYPENLTFTAGDTERYAGFETRADKDEDSGNDLAYAFYGNGTAPSYLGGSLSVENYKSGYAYNSRSFLPAGEQSYSLGGFSSFIDADAAATKLNGSIYLYTAHVSLNAINNGAVFNGEIFGYRATSNISALEKTDGSKAYGFHSSLRVDENSNYNFYAAGNAPNYFAGDVIIAPNPDKSEILNGTKDGKIIQKTDGNLISSRSDAAKKTHNTFINVNGSVGFIKTKDSNLVIEGLAGGPLLLDVDADARKVTSTEELSNASAVVQQLQPVKINGTRHGFTASALEPIFAEAVSGTAGETQAIGTYTPVDGEVEYNVTEPEAIPLGATWQQTGIRDVYQGVDQTKLIPILTKALQEALGEIDNLKERLAALEGA